MSFRRQHIRNIRATIEVGTPLDGEYPFDQTLKTIRAGDGAKLGGHLMKKWGEDYTVSPSQITGNQNNYNPTDLAIAEVLNLDIDADRTITGLAGGAANRRITINNSTAFRLTLSHESASSTAGNRFTSPTAADMVVRPKTSMSFLYSAATSRWIAIGASGLGVTDLAENVALSGDITPSQITSNQNDYSPTGLSLASRLRLSTDALREITGIAGGADGRILIIVNVGSTQLRLKDADAGSTAANRFDFGADSTLSAKQVAVIQYDATDSRWKMLANTAGQAVADGAVTAVKLALSGIVVGPIVNGYLDWSVAGSALTIALKTRAGTDPSASDPVYVINRSATLTDGKPNIATITSALSFTLSSGSSAGFTNNVAGRLYASLFDDGGTYRLSLINCRNGINIYPLAAHAIASSTAEGGAGGADLAHVFYTGTAVAAKPYALLGFATWETGLAAAGTWSAAPTRAQAFGPGVPLPGARVQLQSNATGAVATGTTVIPHDDTIPQNTEGDQYMTQAITPSSAANLLAITSRGIFTTSSAGYVTAALFQDSVASALVAALNFYDAATASAELPIALRHLMLAATASATTFKVRAGPTVGTVTFNGVGGARIFGGVMNSNLEVEEIVA